MHWKYLIACCRRSGIRNVCGLHGHVAHVLDGLEDTLHAILEAPGAGMRPFCVTIGPDGHDYLPRRLTQAWTQLARNGGQGR